MGAGVAVTLAAMALAVGVVGWLGPGPGEGASARPSASRSIPGVLLASPSASSSAPRVAVSPSTATPTPSSSPSARPTAPPTPSPSPSATASRPARSVVKAPVVVLNQTRQTGLAGSVASRLRARGWQVTGVGNWRGSVSSTTVYYAAGLERAARSLADVLGVERIRPKVAGMASGRLTVVLTADPFR